MKYAEAELKEISDRFEDTDPTITLTWALKAFQPNIALASSFGVEDVALIDMLVKVSDQARVFYLDTGFLPKETHETRDRIIQRYDIQPTRYASDLSPEDLVAKFGEELWNRFPDVCCNQLKIVPLKAALQDLQAWITGMRRDQSPTRANIGIVEWDEKFGLIKINPLAAWTWEQVWEYVREHDVPYNPLHDQGYPSIGCIHCTSSVGSGEDPRSGRWRGSQKIECGLHK